MGKHDNEYFSKLFDSIELVHAENMVILNALLVMTGVNEKDRNKLMDLWNDKMKEIRKW